MLNKISAFMERYSMIKPGQQVICAVSGGADSVALLWALYLLRDKMNFRLSAAHFNHGLRGEESDNDQRFVEQFCRDYDIPLFVGNATVTPSQKGLEAAAREARYRFFQTLPGTIATAHTADDNAETVLMHLLRGTGLKGLGGISPVRGNIIRPMLSVTREEVLAFLEEYHLQYVNDSTNQEDAFLRNRLRHHVIPPLREENPRFAENVSDMALRLREDEQVLESLSDGDIPDVPALAAMPEALRRRYLQNFLVYSGVKEPESSHIALAEQLVFSDKPSARASFPGGIVIGRSYNRLEKLVSGDIITERVLTCPGVVELPEQSLRISCRTAEKAILQWERFTVYPEGEIVIRCRKKGDSMRLSGGTKSVKELFIDRKIPASQRMLIPVIADDKGVLGIWGLGVNLDRTSGKGVMVEISFERE